MDPTTPGVAEALVARDAVSALADLLWPGRTPEQLIKALRLIEEMRSILAGVELDLVAEIAASGAAAQAGWANLKDFLTATAGGPHDTGSATVRLFDFTRRDYGRPVADALRAGWLSRAQADVVAAAVLDLPSDASLRRRGVETMLEQARSLNASDLRKAGRHLVHVVDPSADERRTERALAREERSAHRERYFSLVEDGLGGVRLRGRGSVEDGARLRAALFSLAAPTPSTTPGLSTTTDRCGHDGRDPRDHGARMWDAMVDLADRAATADLLPTGHGARPTLVLTMGFDQLVEATRGATTATGEMLSAATVRRLACDAGVIPAVLGGDSAVLDVGRRQRLVTAAQWTALVLRDQHCVFSGCTRLPIACDAHHVRHWVDGGETTLANLVLLCRRHHTSIHQGPWQISVRSTGRAEVTVEPGSSRRLPATRGSHAPPREHHTPPPPTPRVGDTGAPVPPPPSGTTPKGEASVAAPRSDAPRDRGAAVRPPPGRPPAPGVGPAPPGVRPRDPGRAA